MYYNSANANSLLVKVAEKVRSAKTDTAQMNLLNIIGLLSMHLDVCLGNIAL